MGYFKVKRHLSMDWMSELKKIKNKNWKNIYHLIILPTYQEDSKIIKESLDSLVNSNYPKEKLIVVLAIEERAGTKAKETASLIEKDYRKIPAHNAVPIAASSTVLARRIL